MISRWGVLDGDSIMMFVAFGVAAGVLCAFLRYPPISLAAIGALLAAGAVLTGTVLGTHPGVIAVEVFGSIAVPQFTFVAVSLTNHLTRRTRLIPQVQAAIAHSCPLNWKCRAACRLNWPHL